MSKVNLFRGSVQPKFKPQKLSKLQQKRIPKKGVGRPPKEINWDMVERYALIHCTPEEIAACLHITSPLTLTTRPEFPSVYRRGWEKGKASLRRMQWSKAVEGSVDMLKFLGQQILGQRAQWKGEITGENGAPIALEDRTKPRLEQLTLEELQQLQRLVTKAALPEAQIVDADDGEEQA